MPLFAVSDKWPKLEKHVGTLAELFPRIELSNRDTQLEEILKKFIIPHESHGTSEGDFVEASRRIREAIKHDAYLRQTPSDRNQFIELFKNLDNLASSVKTLERHNKKNFLMAVKSDDRLDQIDLMGVRDRIKEILRNKPQLLLALDRVPSATGRTNSIAFSIIQRLKEAWEVISDVTPSIVEASGARIDLGWQTGSTFQDCLQAVADHLGVEANNGGPFRARSAIQAWRNPEKQPAPDNLQES